MPPIQIKEGVSKQEERMEQVCMELTVMVKWI